MLTHEDIVKTLLERVPAFRRSKMTERLLELHKEEVHHLDYVVFGHLASFLNDLLPRVSHSDPTIQASFELLNEMGNSSDPRLQRLAAIGTFEVLTDSPASIRAARQLLYGRAIDLFEEMIRIWGVEVMDL
jgi:hypothetical protein